MKRIEIATEQGRMKRIKIATKEGQRFKEQKGKGQLRGLLFSNLFFITI